MNHALRRALANPNEYSDVARRAAILAAYDELMSAPVIERRKIGPGVYAVGPLGEIEMSNEVIAARRERGLSLPRSAREADTEAAHDEYLMLIADQRDEWAAYECGGGIG